MAMSLAGWAQFNKAIAQRLWFKSAAPTATYHLGERIFQFMERRNGGPALDPMKASRILVVRLDKIGDIVLSTAFLRELRRNLPKAWITLVVSPNAYGLVEHCPHVDEIRTYDWRPSRYYGPFHQLHALWQASRFLWHSHFDLAIVPSWGVDYYLASFLAYYSGARARVGYSESVTDQKQQLNAGFDRLFTHVSNDNALRHEVEHNLDLIRFLGGQVQHQNLELWTGKDDEARGRQLVGSHGTGPGDRPLIALCPGAGAPKRRWPLERFVEIGAWLISEHGARIVVVGGPGEEELGRVLRQELGDVVTDLVARTTLRVMGAVLRQCHLFIGNDSGPMHLAAAAGIPAMEISCHPATGSPLHDNAPERFGPWGAGHIVARPSRAVDPCTTSCSAAQPHCILEVTSEQVKEALVTCFFQRRSELLPKEASNQTG